MVEFNDPDQSSRDTKMVVVPLMALLLFICD